MNAVRHSWLYGHSYNSVAPAFVQDLTSARLPRDPPPPPPRPSAQAPLIGVGLAMAGTACWRWCLFSDFGGMTKATCYRYMIGARRLLPAPELPQRQAMPFGLLSIYFGGRSLGVAAPA